MPASLIQLGAIAGAHGIHGTAKIRTFTEIPEDITTYGPLKDASGKRTFTLTLTGSSKDGVLATIEGVRTREEVEKLRGTGLFIERDALPQTQVGVYYSADLIGLKIITSDDTIYGCVTALHNFGAGDVVEIRLVDGKTEYLSFTHSIFPHVNIAEGILTIMPPDIMEAKDE